MHNDLNLSPSPMSQTRNDRLERASDDDTVFENKGSKFKKGIGMREGLDEQARSTSTNQLGKQHLDTDPCHDQVSLQSLQESSDEEEKLNQDWQQFHSVARRLEETFDIS